VTLLQKGLVPGGHIRPNFIAVIPFSIRSEGTCKQRCKGGAQVDPHSGEIAATWDKKEKHQDYRHESTPRYDYSVSIKLSKYSKQKKETIIVKRQTNSVKRKSIIT